MEHVVVRCSDQADLPVWVDERQTGRTNQDIPVERGTHTFALCPCAAGEHVADCVVTAYRPVSQEKKVRDTTLIRPLEVSFERA